MADKKISQLTAATTPLAGTEVLPIVQSGSTVKVSAADVTAGRAVSAASVAVTGSSAPANGVYLPASNTVGIATNSSTQFRVDSSGRTVLGAASFLNYGGDATLARSQALISTNTTDTSLPVASFVRRTSGTPAAGIGAEIHLCAENNYSNVSQYAVIAGVGTDLSNINGDCVISTMLNNTQTEQVRVTSGGNLKISRAGKGIVDSNGNESLLFTSTASAVNELTVANAATGNGPTISATGSDTNISINLTAKGSGNVNVTNTNLNVTNKAIAASFNTTASTLSVDNNTATTLYTMPGAGVYTVHAYLLNTGLPDELTAIAIISCAGTSAFIRSNLSGANMVFSLSGLNVQITQTAGSTQTVYYSVQRIA